MIWDVPHTLGLIALAVIAGILIPRIRTALQRFDTENRQRIARDHADRRDKNAHFRHTVEIAEEQVDDITEVQGTDPRTGTPVTHYLFEGDSFTSRDAAEQARTRRVYEIAKGFYVELPKALTRHHHGNLGRD